MVGPKFYQGVNDPLSIVYGQFGCLIGGPAHEALLLGGELTPEVAEDSRWEPMLVRRELDAISGFLDACGVESLGRYVPA
jgi:hypothetical protein